jgi:micrococcal nuclease
MRRVIFLIVLLSAGAVAARDRIDGPVQARLLHVIDGDSMEVEARIWLGQSIRTIVRLRGVDAPEKSGRCPAERELAQRAAQYLVRETGPVLLLADITGDKYGGRVVARVTSDGRDLSAGLLRAGLAVPYGGGRKDSPWCAARR